MKSKAIFAPGWVFLLPWILLFSACQASAPLTAIDILLEPDAVMLVHATTDNARLRANDPEGFALDAAHTPHISVLHCYVHTSDLDKVFAAVKQVAVAQKPAGMALKATGYFYIPWQGQELAGITIEPTPELLKYQQAILAAVSSFIVKKGTVAAFVPNKDGAPVGETTAAYVNTFISQHVGENYRPHITIGLGKEDFLRKMVAEPYTPFTFKIKSAGIYHLGDFGTAQKRLWSSLSEDLQTVTGVIDGETLQLSNGGKVRLIGVDVPASSKNVKLRDDIKNTGKTAPVLIAAGKDAAKFLRKLTKNEKVVLEYDVLEKDKSGQRWAYVYFYLDPRLNMAIPEGWYAELSPGTGERQLRVFLNATMIRSGYAAMKIVPPNVKFRELFSKLQDEAKAQGRGLWKGASVTTELKTKGKAREGRST
jgi:endonuclease YncB( thermonuclease family)